MKVVSRKVVVPSALAVLLEVMRDQQMKNPALAAKQARLLEILRQRRAS